MARRTPPKPVTAQMYRHFAVLTVAVTLAVGMFADGENRKAVASEVHPHRAQPAPAQLVRQDHASHGSFSSDGEVSGDLAKPMDSVGATAQDGVIPGDFAPSSQSVVPSGFTRYGLPIATWAGLTEDQRKALIAKENAERRANQSSERAEQVGALLAASRARSGDATPAD